MKTKRILGYTLQLFLGAVITAIFYAYGLFSLKTLLTGWSIVVILFASAYLFILFFEYTTKP